MESRDALVKTPHRHGWLRRFGVALLDLAYPPVCLNCETPTAAADTLCAACFGKLKPITAPLCPILGLPFAVDMGGAVSVEALADPPPFKRARAAVSYGEVAGALVSRLKYGDRPELARYCGRLMASAGHALWEGDPILVPVPLHPHRQRDRRYNQSAELARVIASQTGLRVDTELVRRTRKTRQQVGLSGDGRQRNVAGAFAVEANGLARVGGRRVVLVDDVYTTGATVKAVTRALLRGGVESVDVITFARVVIGDDLPI